MNKENERIINLTEYGELKNLNNFNIEQQEINILKLIEHVNSMKNILLTNLKEIEMFKNDVIQSNLAKLDELNNDLEDSLETIEYLKKLNDIRKNIELEKDYDGDGVNNRDEILRGTNIYVADEEKENEEKNIEWEF